MLVRESAGRGSKEAEGAIGPRTICGFDILRFHSDSNPLLWTDDLELLFIQDLDPEPTKKIAALHHQLPLPASKTSSVPTPRLSRRAHPLRPLAFL